MLASARKLYSRKNGFKLGSIASGTRLKSCASEPALAYDPHSVVLVDGKAHSRTAILNRPPFLNALNIAMAVRLKKLYKVWEENSNIGFVLSKGNGSKAYCAGGDVVALYHFMNKGDMESCRAFFQAGYSLMYFIGTYLKTNVAILNGITMGGGAGISLPGTFRLATDKTVFATPETLIGFHTDAGASFNLSRLPGYLGEYLALTGDKLNGPEMLACGLATHYSPCSKLSLIEEQLGNLVTDDPSVVEAVLDKYGELVYPDNSSVVQRIELVDNFFRHDTVEEIIDSVETEAGKTNDEWCISTLKRLKAASPLALKVSLKSIREGRHQTLDQCFIREYRMSLQASSMLISPDLFEGVRARLIDKDNAPKWNPAKLEHVSKDMVDNYFMPLSETESDLELPTNQREDIFFISSYKERSYTTT